MATADTTRRQHIHVELGSARNVATTADLQHVRQHAYRQVSHFAGQLTGAGDLMLVHLPPEAMQWLRSTATCRRTHRCRKQWRRWDRSTCACKIVRRERINGVLVARLLRRDRQGRALPAWRTYRRLVGDELLLLSSINPKSFDSRHFAPLSVGAVIIRAQLLWSDLCR